MQHLNEYTGLLKHVLKVPYLARTKDSIYAFTSVVVYLIANNEANITT